VARKSKVIHGGAALKFRTVTIVDAEASACVNIPWTDMVRIDLFWLANIDW
jgi:hypothetical protein